MLTHSGFSSWVTSEGGEIAEYESVVDVRTNKISCWIPSEAGKNFVVHWRDLGGGVDTATYLNLDGFVIPGRFLYGKGETKRGSMRVGQTSERPFQFSVAADESVNGKPGAKDAGTIAVKIKRVKRLQAHAANAPQAPPAPRHGRHSAGDQVIGYGQERPSSLQMPSTWNVEPYDPEHPGTFVTFVFRYRSRGFLISQGIMSRKDPLYAIKEEGMNTTPCMDVCELESPSMATSPSSGSGSGRSPAMGPPSSVPSPNFGATSTSTIRVASGSGTNQGFGTPLGSAPRFAVTPNLGYGLGIAPTSSGSRLNFGLGLATVSSARSVSLGNAPITHPFGAPPRGYDPTVAEQKWPIYKPKSREC